MSSYTISPTFNINRVFTMQKSELEKRFDPHTYHIERRSIIVALKNSGLQPEQLKFVSSFKKYLVEEIPENLPYLGLENIEMNPKDSNVYSKKESLFNTTPAGSHGYDIRLFYKHRIPLGLKKESKINEQLYHLANTQ